MYSVTRIDKGDSKIGFEMSLIVVETMWTMCEFHDSNGNGFRDIWWTDKLTYFSSIDCVTPQLLLLEKYGCIGIPRRKNIDVSSAKHQLG